MRGRLILAAFVTLCALAPVSAGPSPWTPVAERLMESVYLLDAVDKDGNLSSRCTGFTINVEKAYILTAAHCDGDKIRVDGTPSLRIYKDDRRDLMVLRVLGLDMTTPVRLAKSEPRIAETIANIGFGFGLEKAIFRIAHVSNTRIEIEGLSGPFIMIDAAFVPGQSGGPVVNAAGELVAIIQRGGSGVGLGIGAGLIRDRVGRYFERE